MSSSIGGAPPPLGLFNPPGRSTGDPFRGSQANATAANTTADALRTSAKPMSRDLTTLCDQISRFPTRQSTWSRLRGKSATKTLTENLKNISGGKYETVDVTQRELLNIVNDHRGPIVVLDGDDQPLYAFEYDNGRWHSYGGPELEALQDGRSPKEVLRSMMSQNIKLNGTFRLDGWHAANGACKPGGKVRRDASEDAPLIVQSSVSKLSKVAWGKSRRTEPTQDDAGSDDHDTSDVPVDQPVRQPATSSSAVRRSDDMLPADVRPSASAGLAPKGADAPVVVRLKGRTANVAWPNPVATNDPQWRDDELDDVDTDGAPRDWPRSAPVGSYPSSIGGAPEDGAPEGP